MARPKVWLPRRLSAATLERARASYDLVEEPVDKPATAARIIEMSALVDAMIPCHSEQFTAEVAAVLDLRLKIIANHSVGVDHCDLAALRARGITVTNTPDVLSDATAEIAMLLMLGAARRAVEGDRIVRSGAWDSWSPAFMVGKQVSGGPKGAITGAIIGGIAGGATGNYMDQQQRDFEAALAEQQRQNDLDRPTFFHDGSCQVH